MTTKTTGKATKNISRQRNSRQTLGLKGGKKTRRISNVRFVRIIKRGEFCRPDTRELSVDSGDYVIWEARKVTATVFLAEATSKLLAGDPRRILLKAGIPQVFKVKDSREKGADFVYRVFCGDKETNAEGFDINGPKLVKPGS